MTPLDYLQQYLTQTVMLRQQHISFNKDSLYCCFEDLVLQRGHSYKPAPLPTYIELGIPQYCYHNCQRLMLRHKDLIYAEGWVLVESIPLPISHAWLINTEGRVVEPTLEVPGAAYRGVELNKSWVRNLIKTRTRRKRKILAVLEGNYLEDYSLLRCEAELDNALNKKSA